MTEQTTEATGPTTEPATEPTATTEPRTYTQDEYDALKEESIRHRLASKKADDYRDALHASALREGCTGVLVDSTDLAWSDDFSDPETGLPDVEKIKAAAEELATAKPHLARVRGDVGQGNRGDASDAVDLAALMRG